MSEDNTRYEEMREQCVAFHIAHPQVFALFDRFTREAIGRGFRNYSAKAVFERIRWETDQADVDGNSTFKMNNNYTSFYARAWMRLNPDHEGFYRLRSQISKNEPASDLPPLGPGDFPYEQAKESPPKWA